MKLIKTKESPGQILCHDVTRIMAGDTITRGELALPGGGGLQFSP
jgi:hypothetical protein